MPDIDRLFGGLGFSGAAIGAAIDQLRLAAEHYSAELARTQASITALLSTLAEKGGTSWLLGRRLS